MNLTAIVAVDKRGGMGCNNGLLCRLPNEMRFFKQKTTDHTVVMGRLTYESIGRPLPNRKNIILTRQKEYQATGCIVVNSIPQLTTQYLEKEESEVFIIGGASIFEQTLNYCDRIYITVIDHVFTEADTVFPMFENLFPDDENDRSRRWKKPEVRLQHEADDKHPYPFVTYEFERNRQFRKAKSAHEQLTLI